MKETNRKQSRVKGTEDRRVVEFFVKHEQFLLPMIDLIEQSSAAIDEMIDVVGRGAVEARCNVDKTVQEKAIRFPRWVPCSLEEFLLSSMKRYLGLSPAG